MEKSFRYPVSVILPARGNQTNGGSTIAVCRVRCQVTHHVQEDPPIVPSLMKKKKRETKLRAMRTKKKAAARRGRGVNTVRTPLPQEQPRALTLSLAALAPLALSHPRHREGLCPRHWSTSSSSLLRCPLRVLLLHHEVLTIIFPTLRDTKEPILMAPLLLTPLRHRPLIRTIIHLRELQPLEWAAPSILPVGRVP